MSESGRPASLTSDEVAIVLRRAVEIEAATADDLADPTRYDPEAVEAAAGEVGLSPAAVRQAVAELRVGSLGSPDDSRVGRAGWAGGRGWGERAGRSGSGGWRGRGSRSAPGGWNGGGGRTGPGGWNGGGGRSGGGSWSGNGGAGLEADGRRLRRRPSDVIADQRSIDRSPEAVLGSLDRLLRGHLFEPGRRTADRAVFRPRDDLVARLRRRLDFVGAIKLDGVSWVGAVATPADGGTLLRVEAEMAKPRSSVVAGSAAAGGGVAMLMGLGGALAHEPALVITALPAGTLIGAGGLRARGQRWEQKRSEIAETLAAVLDRL